MSLIPLEPDVAAPMGDITWARSPLLEGHCTGDGGLSYFDPSDPYMMRLSVFLGQFGDDQLATVFYAGVPVMTVHAGPSLQAEEQYRAQMMKYGNATLDSMVALFDENIVGDLPGQRDEADEELLDRLGWSQPASLSILDGSIKIEDAYEDLIAADAHTIKWVQFIELVAHAMKSASPELPTVPVGF